MSDCFESFDENSNKFQEGFELLVKKKTKSLNLSAFAEEQKINEVLTFLKEEFEEPEEINKYESPFKFFRCLCTGL